MDILKTRPAVRTVGACLPRLRADASRNRERILTAAREVFTESGPEAPLDEIAKRAGVGSATLYRNFPDRTALIRQVALFVMGRILLAAEQWEAEVSDPFEALRRFVLSAADERSGALCSLLSGRVDVHRDEELLATRTRLEETVERLMERARQAGQLRSDVGPGDLFVALAQITRPLPGTACVNLDSFVHRHLHLLLDGLRAPARSPLPGRASTLDDLRRPS